MITLLFLFVATNKDSQENQDRDKFIEESTIGTIQKIIEEESVDNPSKLADDEPVKGLGE